MTTADPFRMVVEPDGDAWHAYCRRSRSMALRRGVRPGDEALENIQQVVEMVVTDLAEAGLCSR